uniref:Uncharacterized protein n=1 Tax=Alsidium seaforthii TaxID=2007182 RepID=A0A1Z1MD47_9FLOR|nr:hypothetical protein [Bryothamnion seaforthii]ARW64017.1 hypothetical protein [Bryothamnion seaforthii]
MYFFIIYMNVTSLLFRRQLLCKTIFEFINVHIIFRTFIFC